jgi:hypothetical protein
MTDKAALNGELTRLHGQLEHAPRLSVLHEEAAVVLAGDRDASRFHLTHAWVYALVAGDDVRTDELEARLRELGGL